MLKKFKNKLIIFEGEDHSGKSTIAKKFTSYLNNNNIETIYTFQPGDNDASFNQTLNDLCKKKTYSIDPLSNLFAFLLDRSIHTYSKVKPALENGKTVICDRWWYSTIAYQFYGKQLLEKYNLNHDFAFWMNEVASHNLKPDVVFYFSRNQDLIDLTDNDSNDLFETESKLFKKRVKEAYLNMLNNLPEFINIEVDNDSNITLQRVINYV